MTHGVTLPAIDCSNFAISRLRAAASALFTVTPGLQHFFIFTQNNAINEHNYNLLLKKTTDLAHANIIESNLNQSAEFFHLSEL